MPRDVNFVVVSGCVSNQPNMISLKNNRTMLIFNLKVSEQFERADGTPCTHQNYVTVEVLGRNADKYAETVQYGRRYQVNGYLRVDDLNGVERTRIRAFNIQADD